MNLENLDLRLLNRTMDRNLDSRAVYWRMELDQITAGDPAPSPRAWLADRLLAVAIRLDRTAGRRAAERLHIQHA